MVYFFSVVIQRIKPFYGLNMDARGIPKEDVKDTALWDPESSLPELA